ncbi:MAG: DNA repair and recombination protein RadA [Candidatus Hermodarchaeota archaeon]
MELENIKLIGENQTKKRKKKIDSLLDLQGVGKATLKRLNKAGIYKPKDLLLYSVEEICQRTLLTENTAKSLISQALGESSRFPFSSSKEAYEEEKKAKYYFRLTTSSENLDDLLGGGIEKGAITELFGESKTGKSQIAHQLAVNVQLSCENGGLQGKTIYIDTENKYSKFRIIQMSESSGMDHVIALSNIIEVNTYSSDMLRFALLQTPELIEKNNVKLLVVDSIINHIRNEFAGSNDHKNRQAKLSNIIYEIKKLSWKYKDLAIVITNQVSNNPDVFYGNPIRACGGNVLAHQSTHRIFLRKGKGNQRVAKIISSPYLPEEEEYFIINEEGIRDY